MAARKTDAGGGELSEVRVESYADRTLPVERSVLRRWLKRRLPAVLIAAAVLIGPFLGGYVLTQRLRMSQFEAAYEALEQEIRANAAALAALSSAAEAAADGDFARAENLPPDFSASRWKLAAGKLNMLDPKTLQAADFYGRLESLTAQYERAMGYVQRFRTAEVADSERAASTQLAAQSAFQQLAKNLQELRRQADALTEPDE